MDKKVFKQSGLPLRRTVELLPEIFQSSANDKFLSATLDPLVQPGTLDRLSGYVGRSYGRTYNSKDIYLDVNKSLRHAYQLEPAVTIENNGKVKKFYDYIDFKNQLKFFNNKNERDDLTTAQEKYSWNPPIDWDKFSNYREYYWVPNGPDTVQVLGQSQTVVSSYKVGTEGANEWVFFPDGLTKNPAITLYRGQTYEFYVNAPGDGFWLRTSDAVNNINLLLNEQPNYNKGVTNNGIEVGKVTFVVPNDAPDLLYYQSGTNINRIGSFRIANVTDNTYLDVEKDILGKQSYKSSNGVVFTNGLKIDFVGKTTPEKYTSGAWIVEGVGDSIKLIQFSDLELPPISNPNSNIVFDDAGFDTEPFDDATSYPTQKDYITINRSSIDKNPWSRYNRWFHRSVLEYASGFNGSYPSLLEESRAKRPIIEFAANLQLFNHGIVAKTSVDLVDDFTTDVFSTIEGSAGYNVDKKPLFDGARVLFTADTDKLVKNKIYVVKFIKVQTSTNTANKTQISLVEADDSITQAGECVIVRYGDVNAGRMYHYDGAEWHKSQTKTAINQAPLFDVFDDELNSFSYTGVYNTSNFEGTRILGYKVASSGKPDSELGFPLSYLNIDNTGDILFSFDWETDTFSFQETEVMTQNVNFGYFKINKDLDSYGLHNNWELFDNTFYQGVIQTVEIPTATNQAEFSAVYWDQVVEEKIFFYLNGEIIKDSWTSETIIARKFTFARTFAAGDELTIKIYTNADPDQGFYEFPSSLERNPLNQPIPQFTLGQANDHLRSMLDMTDSFSGVFPGTSNLRDIVGYQKHGKRFMKSSSVAAMSLPMLCDRSVNIIKSIRYAGDEYERFKSDFLRLAVELPFDQNIVEYVDQIIDKMSKTKSENSPFNDSDMIGSGAYKKIEYVVEDEGIKVFALSEKFDLTSPSTKAVYVYRNNIQLLVDADYVFDSNFGFVKLTIDLTEGDTIEIREYLSSYYNYIPATPTKFGLSKKYTPRIYIDNTYIDPTKVIEGHDGSITIAFNDFRDNLILELEKRIYNNIKYQYNEDILDIDSLLGGLYNTGVFDKDQLDSVLNQEFLRWQSATGVDPFTNFYLDSANPFTYTYTKALDHAKQAKMPGYWRGIYKHYYDTDRPHTCPWEMLGFSEKPTWWDEEYGLAPYTNGNLLLWEDLRDGVIRKGPRAGKHTRYARHDLLDHIPVDDEGQLLNPINSASVVDYAVNRISDPFVFGDIGPVETAWRRSSRFVFSLLEAIVLLRPFETLSLNFDRQKVKRNKIGQIVSTDTNTFLTLADVNSSIFNPSVIPGGLLSYIFDYLKANLIDYNSVISIFSEDSFYIRISNRIGGFVDKNQQKYLLDSKNPKSKTSGVFIPPEDYNIFFNISSPTRTISYSGVIIEKTDNGFKISGYDNLNSYFSYFEPVKLVSDPVLSVGGVSEVYSEWHSDQFYGSGLLVKYNEKFYRATSSHTSTDNFESSKWVLVQQVPLVGAVEAQKRTSFNSYQSIKLPYGTVYDNIQAVVDFLLGYGEYLKSLGVNFDSYNKDLQVPNDWETSCKEFMFWTTHNWAIGAIISLSPAASAVKIDVVGEVADNLIDSFYEYSVLRSDGTKIPPKQIQVYRTNNQFVLTPLDATEGIYFANIHYVVKEHVVVFNDRTVFNDVIYDKSTGYRQERIKVIGFRTTDWDGDYTSPGFIYDDVNISPWQQFTDYRLGDIVQYRQFNYVSMSFQKGTSSFDPTQWRQLDTNPTSGLISNFDYKINQIEDYFELDYVGINNDQKKLARHTIGYQERDYLQDIAEDEVTQFKLYQGFIREKGTLNSITKIFDKIATTTDDAIVLKEEWAFLSGSLGGINQYDELEISIKKENLRLNPQPLLLDNTGIIPDNYPNFLIAADTDYKIGNKNIKFPTKYYSAKDAAAGYVYTEDVDFTVANLNELFSMDIAKFKEGTTVWTTFRTKGWDVLRYKVTNITIGAVALVDTGSVSLVTNVVHNFKVGDVIGLTNIKYLTGFYQIAAVAPKTIIIAIAGYKSEPEIDQSSFCRIGIFETARIADYQSLVDSKYALLPVGSRLWLDDNGDSRWEVIQRQKQYEVTPISEYGIAFPTATGSSVLYLAKRNETIVGNPGGVVTVGDASRESAVIVYSQGSTGLIPLQILVPTTGLQSTFLGSYASVMASSEDGRWLMVGSPTVSRIPSNYRESFNPSATYQQGDTVIYAGKLWKANRSIIGDGSSIDLASDDWTPATNHLANPLGKAIFDINQGYRQQGAVDIFEYNQGQYNYIETIISPRPADGELFGTAISIGKQTGIEGTSGDVTLTVTEVDITGGIVAVSADGSSGLTDAVFENISGTDVSETGANATFDVVKAVNGYTVTVRTGGQRYAVGDRLKIVGSRLGGTTPANDLIITVAAVNSSGEILGSETYNNITGIESRLVTEQAVFQISKLRDTYNTITLTSPGYGYIPRSVVSYGGRYYACIRDTQIDRGLWSETAVYFIGDVVQYQYNPILPPAYFEVIYDGAEHTGVVGIAPPDSTFWKTAPPILPTNTDYWEGVTGTDFALVAKPWVEKTSTNVRIKYTAGTIITIPGTSVGGVSPDNDITIRVNAVVQPITNPQSGPEYNPAITSFSFFGKAIPGVSWVGTASSGETLFNDVTGLDISEPGQGAIFNLVRSKGSYTATVNVKGSRFNVGDQIKILGTAIGGVKEAYYMTVGAPGSLDESGRSYIYKFDGIRWSFLEDENFVGIYSNDKYYTAGSVVWYINYYYKALRDVAPGNNYPSVASALWSATTTINQAMLPSKAALEDASDSSLDSTLLTGQISTTVENLKSGSMYGFSSQMSSDAATLVIGAPKTDSANFAYYRGVWKSYQYYSKGDTVKRNNSYWTMLSNTNKGTVPGSDAAVWHYEDTGSQTAYTPRSGSIFIYKKDPTGTFQPSQIINAENINSFLTDSTDINPGDEFGTAVLLSRDSKKLFVSAPSADYAGLDQGAVYVFNLINGTYKFVQKLDSQQRDPNERFGSRLSLSPDGTTLSIAAEGAETYRTTTFDNNATQFDRYVSKFKDSVGKTGKVYVFNEYADQYVLGEIFDEGLNANEDFGRSLASSNDTIIVGSPKYLSTDPAFKETRIGRIQKFTKGKDVKSWTVVRSQVDQINIDRLKNLSIFNGKTNTKLADIDIIDPYKGKILSIVDQDIDLKTTYDPAIYSVGTANSTVDEGQAWRSEKIGKIWWDLGTVKYTDYEQSDIFFRNGNWGNTAYGSSIDVYEWVETTLLPSEWAKYSGTSTAFELGISGVPLYPDDSNYSLETHIDKNTGQVSVIKYYYWVKNKETLPANSLKTNSAAAIAIYIANPLAAGIPFAAITDVDKLSLYNFLGEIDSDEFLLNIQFYNVDKGINLIHTEYALLSEDTTELPPTDLENKWIDSLIGEDILGRDVPDRNLPIKSKYGISTRPRQSMFVDRNTAVKITVDYINEKLMSAPLADSIDYVNLNKIDPKPSAIKKLYDLEKYVVEELDLIPMSKITPAVLTANIINGKINTVDIVESGYGYRSSPLIKINGDGTGAELSAVINKFGQVTSVTVVNPGKKYTEARIEVRPFSVLIDSDSNSNGYWAIYSWDSKAQVFYKSATQAYDTTKYWTKVDWWLTGYSSLSRITAAIPGIYAEGDVDVQLNGLLRLENYGSGGWAVLEKVNSADATILGQYRLVGRQEGTIQIIDKFYNSSVESTGYDLTQSYDSNRYDTSFAIEFRNILRAVKENIFINELDTEWNKLFFVNVHYVFSEQLYVDWAFKTSFLNATHNVGYLSHRLNYKSDNLPSYQKYIEEVKPYRTKIRKYTSRYLDIDNARTSVADFDLPPAFDIGRQAILPVTENNPLVDTYPWRAWRDNHGYSIVELKLISGGQDYTSVPKVLIEGGGGSGAKARAFVSSGKVTHVILENGGKNYTSAPTVTLVGGVGTKVQNAGRIVAVIGNSKARTFNMSMKFDRYSKVPTFKNFGDNFSELETFDNLSGRQNTFTLKYPSTLDKSKISVFLKHKGSSAGTDGAKLLNSEYTVSLTTTNISGANILTGKLKLNASPPAGATVTVKYEKNDAILDSLNRIDKYYTPVAGMLGVEKNVDSSTNEITSDYSQLVTGIDFGGVIVQGAMFDVGAGWDAFPWGVEGWDNAEDLTKDIYIAADGVSHDFILPVAPAQGQEITVYIRRIGETKSTRIDDPYYSVYDNSTRQPNGLTKAPNGVVMNTFVGDGSTQIIHVPSTLTINRDDTLIFRPLDSDGSIALSGRNLIDTEISGGSLLGNSAYSTATGKTASEIVLDGQRFISPEQVPAPEENVPGQVLESLSIKVFHTDRFGSPAILSRIYTADGLVAEFDIGQAVIDRQSVTVFVDKIKQENGIQYTVDFVTNKVRFINTVVPLDSIVEVFSISVGGVEILDYKEFVGDGATRYYLTGAAYPETGSIFATVDGQPILVGFVNSNGRVNGIDKTLVEFGNPPDIGKNISIVVLSAESGTTSPVVKVNTQNITVTDTNIKTYAIEAFTTLEGSAVSNILVELNGTLLKTVDTVMTYDGEPEITIGIDPVKDPGDIIEARIKVYINNVEKKFGIDYIFDTATNVVTILADFTENDIVRVEDYTDSLYTIENNSVVLNPAINLVAGDEITITWFDQYTQLDLIKDRFEGGEVSYVLQRPSILGLSYVWTYLNGERLTPDIDYYLSADGAAIYLNTSMITTTTADVIEIISFSDQVRKDPISFEIFKDVLNRNFYHRYRDVSVTLAADLKYSDDVATLSSTADLPTPSFDQPGIVTINGEKIQYLNKDDATNTITGLRRGLFGTAIGELYLTHTTVVDTGYMETIPYRESQNKEDFFSTGHPDDSTVGAAQTIGPLSFVPTQSATDGTGYRKDWLRTTIPGTFGPCDDVEVFVGGRRLSKDPIVHYDATVGSYSPAGDVKTEAEFSVDGSTPYIRLTTTVPAGQRITVVRRTGQIWYANGLGTASNGVTLSSNSTPIAKFLQNATTKLP